MSFTRTLLVILLGLCVLGPSAWAAEDKPATEDLPAVLQESVKSGQVTVVRTFETDVPGLTGFVLEKAGQHQIVYGENGYLVLGRIIAPDGTNMSAQYEQRYMPQPDLAEVVDSLESTGHLVTQGPADAPLVYVFADPNCIYCHRFYEQAQPLVEAGKLQLKWAMVGFLRQSSAGRAAAIITADDPAAALVANETGFDESSENGGIEPVTDISDETSAVLEAHARQMADAGGNGTPLLIYRNADGQWVSKIGAPGREWLQENVIQNAAD